MLWCGKPRYHNPEFYILDYKGVIIVLEVEDVRKEEGV